ncbi:hypothetical protein BASA81_001935 [Batrachochytrium salamandrivorans]|nr:hypothetical protein BASA81_001935 [Batrachochytrium salamandrivorans]
MSLPKRAAAVLAEELNRQEIARGLPEDEDDQDDEEYVEEVVQVDHSHKRAKTSSRPTQRYTSRLRLQAEDTFARLQPSLHNSSLLLAALKRAMAEEPAKRKPRAEGDLWLDPMLASFLRSQEREIPQPISPQALDLAQQVIDTFGTTKVTEKVRFAGEMVDVVKQVDKPSSNTSTQAKSMLEEMLEGISKTRSVTTVEKSSYDWEQYKAQHQLEDELKDAGKDGFVEKQQFLHRVDDRQFELERTQRERERAIRDLNA